jgi:hypothetical protein
MQNPDLMHLTGFPTGFSLCSAFVLACGKIDRLADIGLVACVRLCRHNVVIAPFLPRHHNVIGVPYKSSNMKSSNKTGNMLLVDF